MMKKVFDHSISLLVFILIFSGKTYGQDPNFSQFISSPLSINPALTGSDESAIRAITNMRNQWIGIGSPYLTKTISVDGNTRKPDDMNYWGFGGMVLADVAMDGVYKSTYITLNSAYHLALDNNGNNLSLGLGYIYNKTLINFSELSFDSQLSSIGFNRALPQGEPSLSNSPSFSSVCAGIMYTYSLDNISAHLGASGYRFMKSRKSILDDATQYDSPRYDVHGDLTTSVSESTDLSLSAVHIIQNGGSSTTIGGILSLVRPNSEDYDFKMLNLGMFYRWGNALIPYVGYTLKNFQLGLSYDVNVSPIKSGSVNPRTFELSLSYKYFNTEIQRKGKYHSPL